jgi:hypothetical protein
MIMLPRQVAFFALLAGMIHVVCVVSMVRMLQLLVVFVTQVLVVHTLVIQRFIVGMFSIRLFMLHGLRSGYAVCSFVHNVPPWQIRKGVAIYLFI